jgi:polyhydroxybutyrate depolymerase
MTARTSHFFRLGTAAFLLAASLAVAFDANAAVPQLMGKLTRNSGTIGGRERNFLLYLPPDLKPGSPLLLVFHGGGQDAKDLRIATGYEFDLLADKYGFVVVYPDGIDNGWNACRKSVRRNARSVDDVAFIEAIIGHQATVNGIDKKRVFATGHSNGGAISFRLALEHPEEFAGVAVISSSLPSQSDMGCKPKNIPIPMMIINGTADPVNPYRGGSNNGRTAGNDPVSGSMSGAGGMMGGGMGERMEPFRGSSLTLLTSGRGPVMPTEATAAYWAKINGQDGPPERTRLPHVNPDDPTSVEILSWTAAGKPPVILYSIVGGGHVVPQKYFRYPRIVGRQTEDMDAPEVIWDFFSRQPSRP